MNSYLENVDGLHQGPEGVGAAAVVRDGGDFFLKQKTFVKVRVRLGHVIHLPDDPIYGAVGDDHYPRRVDRDGEIGQELKEMNMSLVSMMTYKTNW
jgi:hypothetical protein